MKNLILCACILCASMNVLTAQNNVKLANFKISLPETPFKKAFGMGANVVHSVGFLANRSTRVKNENIDQYQHITEIKLGDKESIVNGQKLKHSAWVSEFTIKGFEQLSATVTNADFGHIKINVKNGVIYSVTLLRFNNDYILFE